MHTAIACLLGLVTATTTATATGLPGRAGATATQPARTAGATGLTALAATPVALNVAFAADRHDYVTRCPTGQVTMFSGTVAAGYRVRAIPLGPGAAAPSTFTGSFTYPVTPPAVTTVRLEVADVNETTAPTSTYRVRCLPSTFPSFTTTVSGSPQSAYYVVTHGNWDIILDSAGTPLWWLRETQGAPVDAKVIDGHIVTTVPGGDYVFRAWDATPTRVVHDDLDHHDLQRTPTGDLIGFQYYDSDRNLKEEARFVRLDPSGHEVWSWRTQDHLDAAEMAPDLYKLTWGHANSVDPHGDDGVLVSIRNLDAIYDIDMATNDISWKLGGTTTPLSLAVFEGTRQLTEAEVLRLFSGQHDARILSDGSVSVFDNGTRALDRRPRVLRFQIDAGARRATLVETVIDPRAGYSFGLGSARRTDGGNWVVSWGGWNDFFTELTPDGAPVLTVSGVSTYRAVPVMPGELDADAMRAGMDSMAGSPTGLTGSVTETGTGAPVPWAGVAVLRAADLSFAAGTVGDAEGDFAVALDSGTYLVYLLDTSGDHRSDFLGAPTPVTVTRGPPTDVVAPMAPTRGEISGRVTDGASGAAVAGTWAVSLNAATGAPEVATVTDASGRYALEHLGVGDHRTVYLDPSGAHSPRFFAGTPDPAASTPIPVSAGRATPADVSLPPQPGAPATTDLRGTVIESATSRPLRGVRVLALWASDFSLAAGAVTGGAGGYRVQVAAGSYRLAFLDPSGRHAMEWHDNVPYHGIVGATPVTAPAVTNAALDATVGALAGTVTDASSGVPLEGAWVIAIGPTGIGGGSITAADGSYTIDALTPGSYRATIVDPAGTHLQEYWDDRPDYAGATTVPITAGHTATIDAAVAAR